MKDVNGKIQYNNKEYNLVFNLNVMESIQAEYGSLDAWGKLTDGSTNGEPDAKAVKFGFCEMLNEGIDIENEKTGGNEPMLTMRQVGRMLTEIGMQNATMVMNQTVIESTQGDSKNE